MADSRLLPLTPMITRQRVFVLDDAGPRTARVLPRYRRHRKPLRRRQADHEGRPGSSTSCPLPTSNVGSTDDVSDDKSPVETNPLLVLALADTSDEVESSQYTSGDVERSAKLNGSPASVALTAANVSTPLTRSSKAWTRWRRFHSGVTLRRRVTERLAASEWWRRRRQRSDGDTTESPIAIPRSNDPHNTKSFPDDIARLSGVIGVELAEKKGDIELQEVVARRPECKQETTDETLHRNGRQRCADCCRQFIAFLFSTVGSCCLMVGYVVFGGLVFKGLEADHEQQTKTRMRLIRMEHVSWLWNLTESMNVLHPDNWTREANRVLDSYTDYVFVATKRNGWDGKDDDSTELWSYAGSLLFSITVITTIGYGHIAPKTSWGQVVTILYAIFGIPLTLFTITNLGSIMATAFRFIYKYICCGLCCVCCTGGRRRPVARRLARGVTRRGEAAVAGVRKGTGSRGGSPALTDRGRRWRTPRTPGGNSDTSDDDSTRKSDQERELTWRSRVAQVFAGPVNVNEVSVPICVSLLLMGGYILLGAFLFHVSENWEPLVAAYFCFITLSTIGFGDYVPGTSLDSWRSQKNIVCGLYLVCGLALIAMCFNLMQEEARNKFRRLGRRLGLIN